MTLTGISYKAAQSLLLAVVLILTATFAVPVQAATLYTVTNLSDSGSGTLRDAITQANANAGDDTIQFAVSGTITLASYLPITDALTIDGTGQSVTIQGGQDINILWVQPNVTNSLYTVNLLNLTLADGNWAGGAALASSMADVNITNVTFRDNQAYSGGAVDFGLGTLTVVGSTFVGNHTNLNGGLGSPSEGTGGAVHLVGGQTTPTYAYFVNSTFYNNSSNNAGGAIANQDAQVTLINTTVAGNTTGNINNVPTDGALFQYPFTDPNTKFTLVNTLVANNTGGNCSAGMADGGGNLSWPDTSCPGVNADPVLGALADNGGPTQTMALGAGSAALDAAQDAVCAASPVNNVDQRGYTRPFGSHCDIGSVEQQFPVYTWNGFFQPVDNPGPGPSYVFNSVKAGSAVPVKFSLGGNQGLNIFQTGYPTSTKVDCSTASSTTDIEQTVTAGNSSLAYDASSDTYTYVWKTDKAWSGTCRKLSVLLNDNNLHTAYFQFK